jgi:hypothetical protein
MRNGSKVVIAVLGVASMLTVTGCTRITGQGEKVGSVIKVSNEGLLFKTNEVEIVRGGMNNGSGAFSTTPLNVTVNDPGILAKIQDALDKQYEVKVRYVDYFWTPLSSDSNSRYLVDVEKFGPAPSQTAPASQGPIVIAHPVVKVENGVITITEAH